MDFRFEIFHIFYAKKRPFFPIFGPPYFRVGGPIFFSGISLIFLHRKNFSGRVPPKTVHLKIPSFLKSDATLSPVGPRYTSRPPKPVKIAVFLKPRDDLQVSSQVPNYNSSIDSYPQGVSIFPQLLNKAHIPSVGT